jgi:DNA-binding transcriptional MerR regulator
MPNKRIPIDRLLDQDVLQEVDELVLQILDAIKVNIGEMERLTGASVAQLRYWEKQDLIEPEREKGKRPVREYTLTDLRRILWLTRFFSSNGWTPKKVKQMFKAEPLSTHLLDAALDPAWYGPVVSLAVPLSSRGYTEQVSQLSLFNFLAPRVAKACLSLICGGLRTNTGFAMTIPCLGNDFPDGLDDLPKNLNGELLSLGKGLLCFHDAHGLTSLLIRNVLYLDDANNFEYALIDSERVGKVVVIGVDPAELGEAVCSDKSDYRYRALERMLAFLLRQVRRQEEAGHISPVYSIHSGSAVSVDQRLDDLANVAVELGEEQWDFCCVLAPSHRSTLWDRADLEIVGRSKKCPHSRDVRLERREGISGLAFALEQIVSVPDISQEPHLIARYSAEKEIQSAIAVPASYAGKCQGVVYVASKHKNAFDKEDEAVLALLGLAVAQVLTTNTAVRQFDDMIGHIVEHPKISDPSFSSFKTKDDFKADLITKIRNAQNEATERALWLLAVDINDSRRLRTDEDGTREEWLLKTCWQRVGTTFARSLSQFPAIRDLPNGAEGKPVLYRTKVDQYVATLENVSQQWPWEFGPVLAKTIGNTSVDVTANRERHRINMTVRTAVWRGSTDFVRALAKAGEMQAVEKLIELLEETLEYSREHGLVAFRNESDAPTENAI